MHPSPTPRPLQQATRALRTLLALALAVAFAMAAHALQDLPAPDTAEVEGAVLDGGGRPAADLSVQLQQQGSRTSAETTTNTAGVFRFSALAAGIYTLRAVRPGLSPQSSTTLALAGGEHKRIDLVLKVASTAANSQMSFSDQPDFTVAGVTDWTAVGGHGSDSILRTSEELARETAALEARNFARPATQSAADAATETRLRAALAGSPGSFAANRALGDFYLRAGEYGQARPLLEAAYRLDPAQIDNRRELALACEKSGDLQQAREQIHDLLQRGNNAGLRRMAGEIEEKLGNPLAAVREYQQAAALDPSEENEFAWGSELLLHRAVWQAAEVFRNGIAAHPESARLHTGLGTALFAAAQYEEAARALCQASDLEPANPAPYLFLGKIEMASPAPLPCVEPRLARYLRDHSDSSAANYLYAMTLAKQQEHAASPDTQRIQRIEALLRKAIALDARCSDGYLQLGVLAAAGRDYEQAIPLYEKAIAIAPEMAEAHYRLGVAYDRMGRREKAQREFALHDELAKRQADAVEEQRRDVKQFVVEQQPAPSRTAKPVTQ